jgi:hypothetical protein
MKQFVLILLSALLVSYACDKEESLKETIDLTIVNKTNNDYLNARLFAVNADYETHSDSLLIEIPGNDSVSVSWKPKLSTSTGEFYFELNNNRGLGLWYYAGNSIADDGPFKLTIEENEIIYK